VLEHPQYAMWKARYEAELTAQREREAMRAEREAKREGWHQAWRAYRTRAAEAFPHVPLPQWWNVPSWWRYLRAGRSLGT